MEGTEEITKIYQRLEFEGNLDEEQITRLKIISGKCPVHKTLVGKAVSYTHLTLPTSDLVQISVVAVSLKKKKEKYKKKKEEFRKKNTKQQKDTTPVSKQRKHKKYNTRKRI